MTQSRKVSAVEVGINQAVGILIGWLIVFLVFPLLDNMHQAQVATVSSAMFFVSSFLRSYVIRRVFNLISK